ncbi:acetylglutamate kinase [Cytobacillus gottheilii]|uniref:acetylglutamate kinase n=1 Tax=Cytobacillus gottheilii TaxID=859144 RepID=UPI0009B9B971|nr:acetylglutamate kinase [Cytobacillus gottheilii]
MKKIVIKCGGSVIDLLSPSFLQNVKSLKSQGYQFIFVHGGGPDINKMLELYHVQSVFVNGLRKTTKEVLETAEMVLSGKTNRKLTALLQMNGLQCLGINGSDVHLLQGTFINEAELGYVGSIESVNTEFLHNILALQITPVITPIAMDHNGVKYNVNADTAAAAVAVAVGAERCIFVTDVPGIKIGGEYCSNIEAEQINSSIEDGEITGGMIPKVKSAISALEEGLKTISIVSGKKAFYDGENWLGTEISNRKELHI